MSTLTQSPNAYRQSAVLTATREQLVVMLYDGLHRFLIQAAAAMRTGQIETAHQRLRRAENIISHLRDTLDLEQGDVAERLEAIYVFCNRHLGEARIHQDAERVESVDRLLGELRDAWAQVARG